MNVFFKYLSLVLVFQLSVGCAGIHKTVQSSSLPQIFNAPDPETKYQIVAKNGWRSDFFKGHQIQFSDIQTKLPNNTQLYNQQIDSVIEKRKSGRNTLKGLGIGSGVGVVIGAIILGAALSSDNSSCEDKGECAGIAAFGGIVGFGVSTALGSLLGLGIGALSPKYKTTEHKIRSDNIYNDNSL